MKEEKEFELHFHSTANGKIVVNLEDISNVLEYALSHTKSKKDFRLIIETVYNGIKEKLNDGK